MVVRGGGEYSKLVIQEEQNRWLCELAGNRVSEIESALSKWPLIEPQLRLHFAKHKPNKKILESKLSKAVSRPPALFWEQLDKSWKDIGSKKRQIRRLKTGSYMHKCRCKQLNCSQFSKLPKNTIIDEQKQFYLEKIRKDFQFRENCGSFIYFENFCPKLLISAECDAISRIFEMCSKISPISLQKELMGSVSFLITSSKIKVL